MTIARVHRSLGVALLVTLALGSLAACTSSPPKPTTAEKCTPATAKVAWSTPTFGEKEPVEAHLLSYTNGVESSTPVPTNMDTDATFTLAGDDALSGIWTSSTAAWQNSLLAGVRRTKSVPPGFGNGASVDPADIHPTSYHVGKFLVVTEEQLTTVPFTITCHGGVSLSGTVSAVADTGSYGTITQCGTTPKGVPAEVIALMGPACTKV